MLQNVSNLGVGIILAFVYGWALTLLILAFIPFMIIAGFLQTYLLTGFANNASFLKTIKKTISYDIDVLG